MTKQIVFLKVYQENQLVANRQFVSDQISIGSGSEGPSLILADPSVNYWHALIEKRGGFYVISDLGSPTGTFVNTKQVLESNLQHGDQITLGDFLIHFYIGVPFAKPKAQDSKFTQIQPPQLSTQQVLPSSFKETTPLQQPTSSLLTPSAQQVPPAAAKEEEITVVKEEPSVPPAEPQEVTQSQISQSSLSSQQPLESDPIVSSEEPVIQPLKQTEIIPSPPDFESLKEKSDSSVTQTAPVVPSTEDVSGSDIDAVVLPDIHPVQERSKGTYAPESEVKNLDQSLQLSAGPIIEVLVAWKERILRVYHFDKDKNQTVSFGSDPKCDICFPNLLGVEKHYLLSIKNKIIVHIDSNIPIKLISKKGEHSLSQLMHAGVITTGEKGQSMIMQPGQLARLDFASSVRVYIRYVSQAHKASLAPVFDFSVSEMMGIMMSCVFMFFLMVYLAIFSVGFLNPEEELESEEVKKATIAFKPPARPVRLKMAKKKASLSIPIKKKRRVKKKTKKMGIKKPGKKGRIGSVASNKRVKKKKKPVVASARPGGSVTTGKAGAPAKSPRKDPTKIGLLGVFGSKGTQKVLDQAYSGTGELAGLAATATGYAGQKESYAGEGIGTKFKTAGSGKGNAMIGISSNIRTRGRGGGSKGYGSGGPLGQRGRVNLVLGDDDWEVGGGVNRDAILRIIRRNKYQIESCYGAVLQKKPDLEGKVRFQWEIDSKGNVRNIKVIGNSTGSGALARCMATRLKRFRFDGVGVRPGQVGVVKIPFAVTKK